MSARSTVRCSTHRNWFGTPCGTVAPRARRGSLTVECQFVLGGQRVDLSEGPTRVLCEPSIVEELHGPDPSVIGSRFDALLVSAVSSNHDSPLLLSQQYAHRQSSATSCRSPLLPAVTDQLPRHTILTRSSNVAFW